MAFYVHTWNLAQGSWNRTYGPFPGEPWITHNFIRDGNGNHLFEHDERPTLEVGWYAQDDTPGVDERRTYGWRRCYDTDYSFAVDEGPFWTDMDFAIVVNDDEAIEAYDNKFHNAIADHISDPDYAEWLQDGFFSMEARLAAQTWQPEGHPPPVARTHEVAP